jgi:ribosomal protein S21|tara:strand:- start:4533 stop:4772 length:240 start_codon:yes stop_codon:yes gene_type:complete
MAYNRNERQGLTVAVYNDNIEQALRKFKKKMTTDGKLQEVKDRAEFTPRFEKRKASAAAAKARLRKQLSMENVTKKRLF